MTSLRLRSLVVVTALCAASTLGCGSAQRPLDAGQVAAGGPTSRIEQRALSDRPALSIIEREGDPECALGFASLAAGSPELHAAFGELLQRRLLRAGIHAQVVAHGLGFELTALGENSRQARAVAQALLHALTQPVTQQELSTAPQRATPESAPPSAVDLCSAELPSRRPFTDAAELERERVATFAADRAALSVVGRADAAAAVADALSAGPDWPELGAVKPILPSRSQTQVVRGERPLLSVALTTPDVNRALGAARELGDPASLLDVRLEALGGGFNLRRVVATAHPGGACLRVDSDVDASPPPEARRLGYAVHFIEEELQRALATVSRTSGLEGMAVSAADPRAAARAAAFRALVMTGAQHPEARLVALVAPGEAPLVPAIEAAIEQARAAVPPLEPAVRVEHGQPGTWALLSFPCASAVERDLTAGRAALFVSAASAEERRGVRLHPWLGQSGVGLMAFTERAPGETEAAAAARLGDELGRALVTPPDARHIATARGELLEASGGTPRPLLASLLEALAPGHSGALLPRGNVASLQGASREGVLARQRELLRQPQRLAVVTPGSSGDAAFVARSLSRWLKSPDAPRPSPCALEIGPAARSELSLMTDEGESEGTYVAFRIAGKFGAEAALLAELLNLPGGALAKTMAEPDLIGAARATVFGTSSARAFVLQVSAFPGREAEAVSRIKKLLERLAAGGVITSGELEAALGKRRAAERAAALDARYRLVQLLEPSPPAPDAAALRRFAAVLRPDAAVIAKSVLRPTAGAKSPASR